MNIVLAMSIFFVVITMIFVTIALLLPEWMGITGKRAKKIMEEQRGDLPEENKSAANQNAEPAAPAKTEDTTEAKKEL